MSMGPPVDPSRYSGSPSFNRPMPPRFKPGQYYWDNKLELAPALDAGERDVVLTLLRRLVTYSMRTRDWRRAEGYAKLWRSVRATPAHVWNERPFPRRLP